jgi:hypothetical protein
MSIVINFAGASLRKPGAYSRIRVAQGSAAQAQLGVMAIIGEADQGLAFSDESGLSSVTWSPDQFAQIQQKYGSGALVDGARIALTPSNDPQILGGAQLLLTLKTNQSTTASLALPSSYGTVKAKVPGAQGNAITIEIDQNAGQDVITITDNLNGISEVSNAIGNDGAIQIQVTAGGVSAATLTIGATSITTAITGTGASNLNISKSMFNTLGQLVQFLNTQPGYVASVLNGHINDPLTVLDRVTAQDIKTAPYVVKKDLQDIVDFFGLSALVDFIPTATAGIPDAMVNTALAGGALGATSQSNFQGCLDALSKVRVNFVVPLFSRDAASDITDGLTDAASSYSIDSIHAALNTHCVQNSTVKGRRERQGFAAYQGTYANAKIKSAALGSARVSLHFQQVDVQNSFGALVTAQPHMLATINAGMKAAAVIGLPNTFKLANISGFSVPSNDFDPETQADDAIDANLTFVERAPGGGFRFVLDNSTYGQTLNAWIYNRPAVLYAADTLAFSIRLNMETFVGQRNSDVTPETVKNLLVSVLDGARSSGIIVPDASTGGKGFKDLTVSFNGNVINTSVTVTLVEGIEFVLNDIAVQRATS